ncbi:SGNH/GDSL hydrolase family protein [Saccharibacillus alkalitolerans]|uniref:SGNH/GDSL hydrolase family protein n=1 Tax=Saccharibacillus alkalitolerans TaxID=2705290 RepID=A0ABX0F595_9BACL|nr:SGNH/GDSL hydrolase family protein [Saccharibacillus alkalitolerans]NGZ75189.1 SGNH/GDSL hydrolase family protein [Saccharibacillus alkalitolerans]
MNRESTNKAETPSAEEGIRYLVSGDSISKGVVYDEARSKYVILKENYVSLLQSSLQGAVRNTSRFGNTLLKGIGHLKRDALNDRPSIVLIEYGGNDCDFDWDEIARDPHAEHRPKTGFDEFKTMLIESIDYLKSLRITPVLMTLPPLNAESYFKWVSRNDPEAQRSILQWLGSVTKIYWWQERYNSTILNVSQSTGTRVIDVRGAFLEHPDFTRFLCSDGIHPNKEGHRLICDKVMEFLNRDYGHLLQER